MNFCLLCVLIRIQFVVMTETKKEYFFIELASKNDALT